MFDDPPVRYRADQTGELREERRESDWSDIDAPRDAAEPPQPVQKPPSARPYLLPPPIDPVSDEPTPRPDPEKGFRAWALKRLGNVEAELRYRRLIDKGEK